MKDFGFRGRFSSSIFRFWGSVAALPRNFKWLTPRVPAPATFFEIASSSERYTIILRKCRCMQEFQHACKHASTRVWKHASMQARRHANMEASKQLSKQVSMHTETFAKTHTIEQMQTCSTSLPGRDQVDGSRPVVHIKHIT